MAGQQRHLRFAWWNLHNFAHYDPNRTSASRWPASAAEHEAKRGRVLTALHELFAGDFPDLLAVCEITREARANASNLP